LSKIKIIKTLRGGAIMIAAEELFRRTKEHQRRFGDLREINFWQALWAVLDEIVYYGGAFIEFNGKVYKITISDDAIMLLLDIYDAYKNSEEVLL
jgi:hypothetical protein